MRRIVASLSILFLIFGAGCGLKESQPAQKSASAQTAPTTQPKKEQTPLKREPNEVEKILLRSPGKYSGKNYNESKVKAELDRLPNHLTAEQYMDEFLKLVAEDFRPYVTTFINFDPSVKVNNATPNENITLPAGKKVHFSLLLDASGSMKEKIGSETKMEAAKRALQQFASKLPKNASISLRIYGHKGSNRPQDKAASCASTEEVYKGTGYDEQRFQAALDRIRPVGWTPIANALEKVKQDIPNDATETVVYVVSDGIETCGGNPAQVAKELSQSNIKTVVNIIGFKIDDQGQKMLKEVAEAGNGEFTDVQDEQSLNKYLESEYSRLMDEWEKWQQKGLKDADRIQREKLDLAEDTQSAMIELNETEHKHLTFAREYLEKKFGYNHPVSKTFSLISERDKMIFNYAYNTGNQLWSQAYHNGNAEWSKIYEQGNKKWSENYQKKIQTD
ncbi:VWA domain-containing protein [Thermoflavimicrobium dichotomicum]|uniref:D-amino-acid dehydrogenase/Ca-activated chloride channel family protein n=1 Tax=Thermoflavimicrobium dichotomicum TaxID=46223 RepID=A0A1I3RJR4_9BACL|nr:VWA domain-containing protein [Thermoflavimicrobium dichotomicum]SFJ46864.1 D-amino-acid dehydrogenase/Ca-activated chloride channel family protein [Thermoflavimicrobium dichotomicum]